MSRNFYAQQDHLGFPIPGTMMFTTEPQPIPKNSYAVLPTKTGIYQQEKIHDDGLRYFVRKKSNGDIIPNTLFINTKQPSGLWYELKVFYGVPRVLNSGFNYSGTGPSSPAVQQRLLFNNIAAGQTITVSHSNTNFEVSTDGSTWSTSSVTYTMSSSPMSVILYIRLKASLSTGAFSEVITISTPSVTISPTITVSGIVS